MFCLCHVIVHMFERISAPCITIVLKVFSFQRSWSYSCWVYKTARTILYKLAIHAGFKYIPNCTVNMIYAYSAYNVISQAQHQEPWTLYCGSSSTAGCVCRKKPSASNANWKSALRLLSSYHLFTFAVTNALSVLQSRRVGCVAIRALEQSRSKGMLRG